MRRRRRSLLATALLPALFAAVALTPNAGAKDGPSIEELAAARPAPTLTIFGATPEAPPSQEVTQASWDTGTGALAQLTWSVDGSTPKQIGQFDPRATVTIPPVPDGARQVLQLSQVGRTPKDLVTAVVQNGKVTITKTERPIPPRDTPGWVDELVQIAPVAIFGLCAVLTALYLRSLWGLRHA